MKQNISKCIFFTIILLTLSGCGNNTDANINTETIVEADNEIAVAKEDNDDSSNNKVTEATGEARQFNSTKRVICYGDSMTEGTGGEGTTMPNTLEKLSGAEVLNYGVYAEFTSCISARAGGNPQYLVEDIVIPADSTPVKAQFSGKYGYEMLANFGTAGINNVIIDGVEGIYSITEDGTRLFTRITPGEEKLVKAGTQLITHAMADKRPDDIVVIWAGNNDNPQTEDEIQPVIDKINEMVVYLDTPSYIIVSEVPDHTRVPVIDEFNACLKEEYGEHYFDLKGYLVNEALDDLGIKPTEIDREFIAKGDIPESIRVDEIHGNADYYRLAGEQLYKRMIELGYLK